MQELIVIFSFLFASLALILHYVSKWKEAKGISADDEASFADLHKAAERLEQRLRTLERILDDEVPDWRSRYYDQ